MSAIRPTKPLDIYSASHVAQERARAPSVSSTAAHWRVVATEYQAERQALAYLHTLGFDARMFVVVIERPATPHRPARTDSEPAFPGYLLTRFALSDPWHRIRTDSRTGVAGILRAVGSATSPAILPDLGMALLLANARDDGQGVHTLGRIDARGGFHHAIEPPPPEDYTGEELAISGHPWLDGLTGICVRSGPERVRLLLSILGGQREVEVPRAVVQKRA